MTLTRAEFEELTADLTDRTVRPVQGTRSRTPSSTSRKIDEVVLVGGSTRMPAVQELVRS